MSAAADDAFAGEINMDTTSGVILVGMIVTASLYGITSGQATWYFRHYRRDRAFLKCLVGSIFSLDTLSLGFYIASMWQYLVDKKLIDFNGAAIPWTSNAQIVCNTCAIVIIQMFYAFRIWTLSKNVLLVSALLLVVVIDFALGILLFVKSVMTTDITQFGTLAPFDIALSSTTAVTDVLLSGTLVTLLIRSRTGSSGSNRMINRLLLYTINTGFLTSVCSVLSLITVVVLPQTSLYVMFYYIGSRMYTVSLLSTLNAREGLRAAADKYGHASLPHITARSGRSDDEEGRKHGTTSAREIVVSIQRDTTVTFAEDDVPAGKEIYRKPYRYKSVKDKVRERERDRDSKDGRDHNKQPALALAALGPVSGGGPGSPGSPGSPMSPMSPSECSLTTMDVDVQVLRAV